MLKISIWQFQEKDLPFIMFLYGATEKRGPERRDYYDGSLSARPVNYEFNYSRNGQNKDSTGENYGSLSADTQSEKRLKEFLIKAVKWERMGKTKR
ncbi:MAG: hypothetical protein MZU91_14590 [Desulfosudis oleivorans]|nr:hypothetical protein [Desulfosudis oleivorans]